MNDDHLHSLLTDAVSDVEPTRDLDLGPTTRRAPHWLPVTVAAALATVLVVTGTAWLVQHGDDRSTAAAPTAPVDVTAFVVVLTRDGIRLSPEQREVQTGRDVLETAVRETVTGEPGTTVGRGFAVGSTDVAVTVASAADGVTVDLASEEDGGGFWLGYSGGAEIALLPQAIAWTVAATTGSDAPVRLTVGGETTTDFLGTDLTEPLVPDPSVLTPEARREQELFAEAEGGLWVDAYAVTQATGTPLITADRVEAPAGADPLQAAVEATVVDGVVQGVERPELLWPAGTEVTARERDGVVEVDFTDGLHGDAPSESAVSNVALQSIVWAATAAIEDPEAGVRFLVRGEPVASLLELDTSRPVTRQLDASVVAPVTIDSIGNGETVSSPFTVRGLATAFEGTVTWKLVRQEQTVRRGFATAGEGGTPSPYSFTVTAPPGSYTLEVRETDPSDGEGRAPFGVVRQVTVQ